MLRALHQLAAMPPPLQPPPPPPPPAAAAAEFELPSGVSAVLRAFAALQQNTQQPNPAATQSQQALHLQSILSPLAASAANGVEAMAPQNAPQSQLLLQLATHLGHTMAAAAGPANATPASVAGTAAAQGPGVQAADESSVAANMLSLSMCALARHQKESLALARSSHAAPAPTVSAAAANVSGSFTIACLVCGDVSSGKHYGVLMSHSRRE